MGALNSLSHVFIPVTILFSLLPLDVSADVCLLIVDTILIVVDHFWCPMGVTIWTIGNGGKYASDGRTIKIFAQNLVDHGSTKIPYFDDFPF